MNENCIKCSNYQELEFMGKKTWCCMANVNYPEKCILGKARQILKDLDKEIFDLNGEFRFVQQDVNAYRM